MGGFKLLGSVRQYNDIPRFRLKLPASWPGCNKQTVSDKIFIIPRGPGDKPDPKIQLLSKLVLIKYYRQTGFLNNVADTFVQHCLWNQIESENLVPEGLEMVDLMRFIKNDGYLVQKKIPSTFKSLLLNLDAENRQNLVNSFPPEIKEAVHNFLINATSESWPKPGDKEEIQVCLLKNESALQRSAFFRSTKVSVGISEGLSLPEAPGTEKGHRSAENSVRAQSAKSFPPPSMWEKLNNYLNFIVYLFVR